MRPTTLILSFLISIVAMSETSRSDEYTFQLDTIPDDVTSFSIIQSNLTLTINNPVSATGLIDADDPGGANRGLTFDFQGAGTDDMSAVDFSFDRDTTITGYSISVSSNGYNDNTYTMSFGTEAGLSTALNDHTLPTPIDLASGQNLTISESTGSNFGQGSFIISSITVEAVPEPTAFLFLAMGGLALSSRRKRKLGSLLIR
jgi:hypothetical protein